MPKPIQWTRQERPRDPKIIVINPLSIQWRQVPYGFPEITAAWAIINESANPVEFAFKENADAFLQLGPFDMMTFDTRPVELWVRGTVVGGLFRFIAWRWETDK